MVLDLDAEHIPSASDRASWRSVEILNFLTANAPSTRISGLCSALKQPEKNTHLGDEPLHNLY